MFGQWLKTRREELRLTQPEVAENLGVTQQTVSNWETSHSRPGDPVVVQRLARLLDVTYDQVVDQLADPRETAGAEEGPAVEVLDERLDRIETEMAAQIERQEGEIAELRQQVEQLQKTRKAAAEKGLGRKRTGR